MSNSQHIHDVFHISLGGRWDLGYCGRTPAIIPLCIFLKYEKYDRKDYVDNCCKQCIKLIPPLHVLATADLEGTENPPGWQDYGCEDTR